MVCESLGLMPSTVLDGLDPYDPDPEIVFAMHAAAEERNRRSREARRAAQRAKHS